MTTLTIEQERRMDRGEQPYVVRGSERMAVHPNVMAELGLATGQKVSHDIVLAILRASRSVCQDQIAMREVGR